MDRGVDEIVVKKDVLNLTLLEATLPTSYASTMNDIFQMRSTKKEQIETCALA